MKRICLFLLIFILVWTIDRADKHSGISTSVYLDCLLIFIYVGV